MKETSLIKSLQNFKGQNQFYFQLNFEKRRKDVIQISEHLTFCQIAASGANQIKYILS